MNDKNEERFFHISCNDDGDVSVAAYTRESLEEALNKPAEFNPKMTFATKIPDNDPQYWQGASIIIRGEIVVPSALEVKTKLVLP